jgi:UDP-glucose 6-dehydrogenase
MSVLKLKNRLQKLKDEVFGFGGSIIPKEEQTLVAQAKTEGEANNIFESLKGKLREKYGDFPDEDVLCIWCRLFGTAG